MYRTLRPARGEPMTDICYECGAFYEKTEFVVTDLYKVRRKRIHKRLDHFEEVLCQFQGKEASTYRRRCLTR